MENAIEIVRGTTNAFAISLKDKDTGETYVLETGEVLRFGVKKAEQSTTTVFDKTIAASAVEEDNTYTLTINPDDTLMLPTGRYYYDIGLQSGDDYFPVISWSPFVITPNATRKQ